MEKTDISLWKLIKYNLLFFIPLIGLIQISYISGKYLSGFLEASPIIVSNMLMIVLSFFLFFFIIPYIRTQEKIKGVRYVLIGFLIVGIGMTIVPILRGRYDILLIQSIYYAHYIFLILKLFQFHCNFLCFV